MMFGYGNGSFTLKKNILIPIDWRNYPSVALGDLNEDGQLDVITNGEDPYCFSAFLGHRDNLFEAQNIYSFGLQRGAAFEVVVGDFTGDSHSYACRKKEGQVSAESSSQNYPCLQIGPISV